MARSLLVLILTNIPILGPFMQPFPVPAKKESMPSPTQATKYVPSGNPPPTRFAIKCHPRAEQVCAELDDFFVKRWPFKDQKARDQFRACKINLWACMAIPLAHDDRIHDACKVNTLLFLLDDVVENMSVSDGKKFYRKLIPIAMGQTLPNRSDPYEAITYDIWASMRACDPALTNMVLQQALVCITAQVDEARSSCKDMGSLLRQRTKEAGIGFVAAAMCYGMRLRLTPKTLDSIPAIDASYARLGVIVNDIHSFDKEIVAWNASHAEGAKLLNMVYMFAHDTGVSYEAAKRVLWVLTREWELEHLRLVREREERGCGRDLKDYLRGMELVLGGNEEWSGFTERYYPKA